MLDYQILGQGARGALDHIGGLPLKVMRRSNLGASQVGVSSPHNRRGCRVDCADGGGKPARLLLDLTPSSVAGQRKRAQAFLRRLRRYDRESTVVVAQIGGTVDDLDAVPGITVVSANVPGGRVRAVWRLAWQNMLVPRLMRQHELDTYLSFSHYLPWTLPRATAAIMGVSNLAPFSDAAIAAERSVVKRIRLRALKRTILSSARRADRVIALSQTCREVLCEHGISRDKIVVVPNGVDMPPQEANNSQVLAQQLAGERYILFVSNFYRYKNFERLVGAYACLPTRLRATYGLLLVGYPVDKIYFSEIQEQVRRLRTERITLVPGVSTGVLTHLYKNAALFVFPSLVENCPNVLLEAMACGAPVVASKVQPMREFGGEAVKYFDPMSIEDLSRAITSVLTDDSLRTTMKRRSAERAARYSWDEFTRKVVAAYAPKREKSL